LTSAIHPPSSLYIICVDQELVLEGKVSALKKREEKRGERKEAGEWEEDGINGSMEEASPIWKQAPNGTSR
jgi:hypothetical protein